jgi:rhodanese-related sulfurtransferase
LSGKTAGQFFILAVLAAIMGLGVNLVSPNRIAYVGKYRSLSSGDGPIVPPAAEVGDPPFIDMSQAHLEFTAGKAVFVDARDSYEFECGTIPGAVNIPFEYMPEGDLGLYFDSALGGIRKDNPVLVFCGGDECDLSLHLGRNLQDYEYSAVQIFFGGSREWERFGLEVERKTDCGE